MPLIKGKSPASFEKNVKNEYEAGKPLKQSLAMAYQMKKKARKMAAGGFSEREQESGYNCPDCASGHCQMHGYSAGGFVAGEKSSGYDTMPMDHEKMNMAAEDEDEDMISRIMKKRMMSMGGRVANEDHGPNNEDLADFEPNEFDDLSLRDDLDSSYTGANSGDELGDEQEDEDRHDIVSRIMRQRKMKDRMPIAGYGTTYGKYK